MLWKMLCFKLQSMARTNHKFPIYATQNVQTNGSFQVMPFGLELLVITPALHKTARFFLTNLLS